MIVRSHLPWPLRWVVVALALGFSAAIALWAFEFGKDIAGLDRTSKDELAQLRLDLTVLRAERDKAQAIANTADSLLKAGQVAQDRLAAQLRQAEAENLELKGDLGFFQQLLPAASGAGLAVRALQAQAEAPGRTRYRLLLMQSGKQEGELRGRYEVLLTGTLDGRPWSLGVPGGAKPFQLRQYARLEGAIEHPEQAVVKAVQVRVTDAAGHVLVTQSARV